MSLGQYSDAYLIEVGRFSVKWSYAETALDVYNLLLHVRYGGDQVDPQLPKTGLKRKIDYFRKVHRQSPAAAPLAEKAMPIIERLAQLRDWRHTLIHGLHVGDLFGDEPGLVLRLRHIPSNIVADHHRQFTASQIRVKAFEAASVGSDLLQAALNIGGPSPGEGN
jgi:hypothetical protein